MEDDIIIAKSKRITWPINWPLAGLTLLALALRLFRLDFRSIWLDEAYSLKLASATLAGIIHGATMDIHPPLFHLILGGWIRIFGTSEFALRSLSALAGCLLVPASFGLAREWGGQRTAWWTAGLVTVSPYFLELSRSGRMGSLFALWAVLSLLFFWRLLQKDSVGNQLGYWASTVAAVYTHYFGFLLFLAQHFYRFVSIGRLNTTRKTRRNWAWMQLFLLMAYLPWLPVLMDHMGLGGPSWRGTGAFWWEPFHSVYSLLIGTACWTLVHKAVALVLLAAGAGLGAWAWLRQEKKEFRPETFGLAATVVVVPLGLVWIYSQTKINVFDNRYLSFSAWALLFFLGSLLASLSGWRKAVAGILVFSAFCIPVYNQYFVYGYYDDWRSVSRFLQTPAGSGAADTIAVYPAWNETPLDYYLQKKIRIQGLPGKYNPLTGITRDYFNIDPQSADRLSLLFPWQKQIWLVQVNEGETQQVIAAWFADHYAAREDRYFGSIRVTRFERKAE
jgi:4-amino-4-deoxy-L-arabinose transferase-like glycosyltransferase